MAPGSAATCPDHPGEPVVHDVDTSESPVAAVRFRCGCWQEVPDTAACPTCNGTGVDYPTDPATSKPVRLDCERCGGTGEVLDGA